jgi:hypothetical protein
VKILFVGPTLHGEVRGGRLTGARDVECRGPAAQGDIAKAVLEGATVIGLIDGRYEDVAAPWHKEILFALNNGAHVLGAGSLGALRAAECAVFGMIGIGAIFERLVSGEMVDDSEVAQLHAPGELDYFPLTEALVNVEETFRHLVALGVLDAESSARLCGVARSLFFKQLTFEAIFDRSGLANGEAQRLSNLIRLNRVDIKRRDARMLVKRMSEIPSVRNANPVSWQMSQPVVWRRYLSQLQKEV